LKGVIGGEYQNTQHGINLELYHTQYTQNANATPYSLVHCDLCISRVMDMST
jgi:hypothetical protein